MIRSQIEPDDDVAGCFHEDDFEQRQDVAAGVVSGTAQEEPLAAQEAPLAAPDEEAVERWCAAEARRRRVDRDGAELERVPARVVGEEREHVRREVEHHQMRGVLLAHESAREQREAGLHEQHKVAGIQRPADIGRDADVADRVGELHRQRLLCRLGLVLVEGLLLCCVVGIGFVGRLWHYEGVSAGVDGVALVPQGDAGGIGLLGGRGRGESA